MTDNEKALALEGAAQAKAAEAAALQSQVADLTGQLATAKESALDPKASEALDRALAILRPAAPTPDVPPAPAG